MKVLFTILNACLAFYPAVQLTAHPKGSLDAFGWDSGSAFAWIKEGNIYTFGGSLKGSRVGVLLYYVERNSESPILLTSSMSNLSRVISLEKARVDEAFIREELPGLLLAIHPEPGALALSPSFFELYKRWYIRERAAARETHLIRLGQLCLLPKVQFRRSDWSVSFSVINRRGGVESWVTSGRRTPFSIDEHSVKLIVVDGTFPMMPQVGEDHP